MMTMTDVIVDDDVSHCHHNVNSMEEAWYQQSSYLRVEKKVCPLHLLMASH